MAAHPWTSALVTGASSGIGEAITRRLAAAGVPVVVVARRADRLAALAAELPGVEVLAADLERPDGLARVAARLRDVARPVDLLVNNAGFGTSGPVASIDADRSGREIDLNVKALVRLTQEALPGMLDRRRGWILNVSSVAAFQPMPDLAVYGATKAFVSSFTEALHEELRGTGVHATALCPGVTPTEFGSVARAEAKLDRLGGLARTSADQVAAEGLSAAARGLAVSVPGVLYKAMVGTVDVVPRAVVRRMMGRFGR
jgi:uncharacterized protein